ncbi:MAG: endo alpha-1,4 polygalactosaminidase [Anaerolinea sp.]|nr:endo alpha-1,4 polygalactosaminidase [Anaerolinea sp.]
MKCELVFVLLASLILSACGTVSVPQATQQAASLPSATQAPTGTPALNATTTSTTEPTTIPTVIPTHAIPAYRVLPQKALWQIQYTGEIDIDLNVGMFNLDLFDTPREIIEILHQRGVFMMCYFSAGSYEDWRQDSYFFPPEVLGKDMKGWPGEKWLDISRIEMLAPIMEARLDLAVQKGCDGVDPDNVNGYTNDTGFPLSANDQIAYNIFLSRAAYSRGLLIGLKNDLEQIPELLPYFDWILNESCFSYRECDKLLPFVQAGKPVFVIEYEVSPQEFCPQANQMGFNAIRKNWELDAYRTDCQSISSP